MSSLKERLKNAWRALFPKSKKYTYYGQVWKVQENSGTVFANDGKYVHAFEIPRADGKFADKVVITIEESV